MELEVNIYQLLPQTTNSYLRWTIKVKTNKHTNHTASRRKQHPFTSVAGKGSLSHKKEIVYKGD